MRTIRSLAFVVSLTVAAISLPKLCFAIEVPGDFPTIQAAIDAAPSGSNINVAPGVYNERLSIVNSTKSLKIIGTGGATVTTVNAGGGGRALTLQNATGVLKFKGLKFRGGSDPLGGGLLVSGFGTAPRFVASIFKNNVAPGAGGNGGGAFVTNGAAPIFKDCTFKKNEAGRQGGGLNVNGGANALFVRGAIASNRAGTMAGFGSGGGGIYVFDASAQIFGTRITANHTSFAGGGIHFFNELTSPFGPKILTLQDCEISQNVSVRLSPGDPASQGGGIHAEDLSTVSMNHCRVIGNVGELGGGFSNFRARLEITSSVIADNVATDPAVGFGGGIASFTDGARKAKVFLADTSVVRNQALFGGGLYHQGIPGALGKLVVTSSLVGANQSLQNGGGIMANATKLVMDGSHVLANRVNGGASLGGGMVVVASGATITGSTIASNLSPTFGGGIVADGASTLNLFGSVLYANVAGNGIGGGGLFVGTNGGITAGTVSSNVIADNGNFQIAENNGAASAITYSSNSMSDTAGKIYVDQSSAAAFSTAAQFNAGVANGRASGNVDAPPTFVSFLAAPSITPSTLSWSVGRGQTIDISGVGNNLPQPTGLVDVGPMCTTTYQLTGTRTDGSAFPPASATVAGGC